MFRTSKLCGSGSETLTLLGTFQYHFTCVVGWVVEFSLVGPPLPPPSFPPHDRRVCHANLCKKYIHFFIQQQSGDRASSLSVVRHRIKNPDTSKWRGPGTYWHWHIFVPIPLVMVIFRFSAFPCGLILPVLPNIVPRIPQKTNYLPDERKRFANEYLQCNIMLFASGGRICIMHLPKSFKNGKFVLKNCCIYYLSFTNIHKRWPRA